MSSRQRDFGERQRVVWKLSSPTGLHSDGPAHAEGTTGQIQPRNGMSLVTVAHCSVVDTGECDARIARKTGTRAHAERNPVELEFKGTRAGSRYIVKGRPKRREILFSSSHRGGGAFSTKESQSTQIRGGAGIVTLERIPGAVSSTRAFCSPSISSFG